MAAPPTCLCSSAKRGRWRWMPRWRHEHRCPVVADTVRVESCVPPIAMSRADKWGEFKTSLKSAFGQFFPLLAQQLDHECDPTKEVWVYPGG